MEKISVIGSGSWGTTIACLLGEKGYPVNIWTRRQELADEIRKTRINSQYLPGAKIPQSVAPKTSIKETIEGTGIIFSAVPSEFVRNTMKEVSNNYNSQIIVSATKGIEHHTGLRMSQIISQEIKNAKIAVLTGPNHAEEVSMKMPTASVVACESRQNGKKIAECLKTNRFRTYYIPDVVGAEICGALKNITAIATGICDGLGLGDNAKASLMTLGLVEMNNFGKHFWAKRSTIYGLAGVGDLIATCSSKHSRNRFVGEQLAKGKSIDEIRNEMKGMVAEGVPTTRAVHEYSRHHGIKMPMAHQAYEVIFNKKEIKKAMNDLINMI